MGSSGWLKSSTMSKVNSSDHSTSSLSMSNLLKNVGFSLPLTICMDTIWNSRVDSGDCSMDSGEMSSIHSRDMGNSGVSYGCGWDQSSSIVNTSDHASSSLSMSNLFESVGLGLPLAIGMNTIWIGRVDTSNMGHNTKGIA